ncbi:MAG: hypothetical protein JWN86_2036 [Planctomycetota bacterium]|nr:hypothetical protein [Planctomycetota bacterium]
MDRRRAWLVGALAAFAAWVAALAYLAATAAEKPQSRPPAAAADTR